MAKEAQKLAAILLCWDSGEKGDSLIGAQDTRPKRNMQIKLNYANQVTLRVWNSFMRRSLNTDVQKTEKEEKY